MCCVPSQMTPSVWLTLVGRSTGTMHRQSSSMTTMIILFLVLTSVVSMVTWQLVPDVCSKSLSWALSLRCSVPSTVSLHSSRYVSRSLHLSLCLSVYLFMGPCVCLSACLCVCLPTCLFICPCRSLSVCVWLSTHALSSGVFNRKYPATQHSQFATGLAHKNAPPTRQYKYSLPLSPYCSVYLSMSIFFALL